MSFDPAYLDRNLSRRIEQTSEDYAKAVEGMMRHHAAAGRLSSGATLREMERLALEQLTSSFNNAATFAYSLAGHHGPEVVEPLAAFANRITANIIDYLKERGRNTGIQEDTVNKHVDVIVKALGVRSDHLVDDLNHGMMADGKLKKDPLVSLSAHQTNSPGAIQQLGVGDFSQSALIQNHQPLVEAIDRIETSDEFANLNEDRKALYRAYAEALKEEASEPKPDAGKMRKRTAKLLEFCRDTGMTTASSAIGEVIAKIFVG